MPESTGVCPNEALRSELHSGQLPDCRAYELVTPAYKEGQYLSAVFAVSQDGSHLLGSSLGVLPGAAGDGLGDGTSLLGATYELSRTSAQPASWTAVSLDPPRSMFRSNGVFDASADLTTTLWELGRHRITPPGVPPEATQCPASEGGEELQPEGVTDLYHEGPAGTFVRVGPATPEPCESNEETTGSAQYTYIGGSADLSRVLFSTQAGFRWPFDETVGEASTLYEYVGTGHVGPSLVGVVEDGKLVSDCGTRLGSSTTNPKEQVPRGSMYNAISASGERIFFTAVGIDDQPCGAEQPEGDELFAREETPMPGSGSPEMHTVPISCPEALSPACADANFEGASNDGSKVFFTSTQKLLEGASEDSAGADSAVSVGPPSHEERGCARTVESGGCNLYEDELSGSGQTLTQKLVLVSGGGAEPQGARVQGVARISEDGSHVYFVAKGRLTGKNAEGQEPLAGGDNLYVYERDARFPEGHTSFIAALSPSDEDADWARADDRQVQASWEGLYLVFTSVADLTREDVTAGEEQVFQYDAGTEALLRASVGQDGYGNDNRTPANGAAIAIGPPASYSYSHHDSPTQVDGVLAPQEGAVFFTSPDALTPHALNDQTDTRGEPEPNVYEYRAGNVYLISDGHDESTVHSHVGVLLLGSDLTGDNVFFTTSDPLVSQDTDTQQDIYDARVDGGISPAASPPSCSDEEECRGALGSTPALPEAGSALQPAELGLPIAPSPATPLPKAKPKTKTKPKVKKGRRKHRKAMKASREARSRPYRRIERR